MVKKMDELFLFTMSVLVVINHGYSSGIGKCPWKSSMKEFNITKFEGVWYEVERSFYIMEMIASCTSLNFTLQPSGNLDLVASTINRWTDNVSTKSGVAIPLTKDSSVLRFKLNSHLPYPVARMLPGAGIYYVLHTNYHKYAVVWTCTTYPLLFLDRFWILGRERDFTAPERIEIYNMTKSFDLDPDRLISSKNYFCD